MSLGRPHFQGFRQQGVAGVVEGLGGDGPGGVPVVAVLVDEDAHELGDADDRVGVVKLEGDLVYEGGQIRLVLARVEDADGVMDGGGHEEVLLFETQRLAGLHVLRVVRTNLVVRLNSHQAALRAAEQHTDTPPQLVGGELIGGGGQVDESEIQIDALIFAGHEQQCRFIGATATKHTKVSPSTTLRRCRKTPRTKQ